MPAPAVSLARACVGVTCDRNVRRKGEGKGAHSWRNLRLNAHTKRRFALTAVGTAAPDDSQRESSSSTSVVSAEGKAPHKTPQNASSHPPPKGPGSAANALQDAECVEELLQAASLLVLPEEESLHWHGQHIHRNKRRVASSRALTRLAKWLASESCNTQGGARELCVMDPRFTRLVECVAAEVEDDESNSNSKSEKTETDLGLAFDAFRALGSLAPVPEGLKQAVVQIASRVSEESEMPPHRASICVWASGRLGIDRSHFSVKKFADANRETPFRVLTDLFTSNETDYAYDTNIVDTYATGGWESAADILAEAKGREEKDNDVGKNMFEKIENVFNVKNLAKEVPFKVEKLVTRDGVRVEERRETCWMADKGIGGLAYSGKVMSPVAFTPTIDNLRNFLHEKTGQRFDCCLINLYPEKSVACKWHKDPDLGRLWARDSVIVSIGETRKFGFRKDGVNTSGKIKYGPEHWFRVQSGDAIWMFGDCNDVWEHCVYPGESDGDVDDAPRASVVFKRSLAVGKGGGKRGHAVKSTSGAGGGNKGRQGAGRGAGRGGRRSGRGNNTTRGQGRGGRGGG